MKLFVRYLWQKRGVILAGIACLLIFFVVFYWYHLPLRAVCYPAGLCALLGAVLLSVDFFRVRDRHRTLERMRSLTHVITEDFPPAKSIEQADDQRLIALLAEEHRAYCRQTEQRYSDMIEYYTVWAHQIKTPIASMRLSLQNEDTVQSRKLSADLFRIEQYVQMVLMFLRLDAPSTDYLIRSYELDDIVKQAVRRFAGEFINRKLTLHYEPLHATVVTDEKWLCFVIEQILSNALKYTPAGSITISLLPPKRLCIRDTGIGIAPEDLPRIFENGYTGRNGRTDKHASGIGLYLCRRICKNLGHTITAQSVVGEGTTVILDLTQDTVKPE